ncbi:hypothetical protein GGC65_003974 [Sphingopyxis sp. OAS728]|uniref:hypothetical protein n=1 Tax=Sphingopyxis sp. OAS728 TaxID=2663823 RepID=UPI00178AC5E3|nr:hypothetical protein [Sphingopyxis sp. OAS728]MBE1529518.1 hypothetical protein [Sphingopyxis sp. OAS728]
MSRTITGWRLPASERDALLRQFRPHYSKLVADHVTLRFGTDEGTALPTARLGEVVGEVDDGEGVHALVVRIDGTTDRGDGSHYHITWSLGPGRQAKESNDAIAARGWERVYPPIGIALKPERWSR